jgi:hypothetical protein
MPSAATVFKGVKKRVGCVLCVVWDWLWAKRTFWIVFWCVLAVAWLFLKSCDGFYQGCMDPPVGVAGLSAPSFIISSGQRATVVEYIVAPLLGAALVFWGFACPQRTAVLRALASGYYNNFLKRVIEATGASKIVVMRPAYDVLADPRTYEKDVVGGLTARGLDVTSERVGPAEDPRTILAVKKNKGNAQLVYLDISRNLTVLKDLTDEEMRWFPTNKICTAETKYKCLRRSYFRVLWESYVDPHRPPLPSGKITLADEDIDSLERTLRANMS